MSSLRSLYGSSPENQAGGLFDRAKKLGARRAAHAESMALRCGERVRVVVADDAGELAPVTIDSNAEHVPPPAMRRRPVLDAPTVERPAPRPRAARRERP